MPNRTGAKNQNQVLAALGTTEYERLLPHLEAVELERGQVLFEPGARITHIYFPTTAIVSLLCATHCGESSAIALTGAEGLVGAFLCVGREIPATRAVVHSPGACWRAAAAVMQAEFARGGALQAMAFKCTLDMMVQMAQTAVCNRHHKLEQQLCRWILMTLDRSSGDLLYVTQERIASLLGVRREGVSTAAHKLEVDGLILGNRGRIRVINRAGLERRACECYATAWGDNGRALTPSRA